MSAQPVSETVRGLLRDVLEARARGEGERRLRAAHAYVDGYMRAMIDAGLATPAELMRLVAAERERLGGAATAELDATEFDDEGALPAQGLPLEQSTVRARRVLAAPDAVAADGAEPPAAWAS